MKKVSVEGIIENAGLIFKSSASTVFDAKKILDSCEKLEAACNKLNSYNGKMASSKQKYNIYIPGTVDQIEYIQTNWSTWNISDATDIINGTKLIKKYILELNSYLESIGIQTNLAERSALNIEGYNKLVNEAIASGTVVSTVTLEEAFSTLKNNIAWDEYSAAAGNWEGVSDENVQWWTDKLLRFKKDDKTGAYLVEQQDENGNWVGMGWTNEATALAYIAAFDKKNSLKSKEPTDQQEQDLPDTNTKTSPKNENKIILNEEELERLKNKKNRTKVEDAILNNYEEIKNSTKSTITDNMVATTQKISDENGEYYLTHVVIDDASQIVVENGNGGYGKGLETTSSMAKRSGATIAINGSHFVGDGTQDIKNTGTLKLAINNGEIKENYGPSLGMEICVDKEGKIFSPEPGTTAQELIDMGVTDTFSSHEANYIENGQIIQWDSETMNKTYPRTIIGMKEPGEYVILTGTTSHESAANILKNQGCTYAASMDQGGSTTLVYENEVMNNPTDGTERKVGDMLGFTS